MSESSQLSAQNNESQRDWHGLPADEVVQILQVDPHNGLSQQDAAARHEKYGANSLPDAPRRPTWLRLLLQFHNPTMYMLIVAGVVKVFQEDYVGAGMH